MFYQKGLKHQTFLLKCVVTCNNSFNRSNKEGTVINLH